jgi:hypothetical protein
MRFIREEAESNRPCLSPLDLEDFIWIHHWFRCRSARPRFDVQVLSEVTDAAQKDRAELNSNSCLGTVSTPTFASLQKLAGEWDAAYHIAIAVVFEFQRLCDKR